MKKTEFKVHTIYSKQDILQMEKVSIRKLRLTGIVILSAVLVLYAAVFLWETVQGEGYASLLPSKSGALDIVLMAALAFALAILAALPHIQTRRILKNAPGGVLKANYYFYEKTFQYGWGDTFQTIAYAEIQEFRILPNTFYMKAKDLSYWVKKADFVTGDPEKFSEYMKQKVSCKVAEK